MPSDALIEHLGANCLTAYLWATQTERSYPLSDDELDKILNRDPDGYKADGYQWVEEGLAL